MKAFLATLLLLALWMPPCESAPDNKLSQTVQASLRSGNAEQLSTHFAQTIELIIDIEDVEFPVIEANHAELILRSFFRKHPPQGFQFVHRRASDGVCYHTGTYATEGQNFAVYVLMRRTTNQHYTINALHFKAVDSH